MTNKLLLLAILMAIGGCQLAMSQSQSIQITPIAFYNLENLFDTIDDPNKKDEDFTPTGPYKYNSRIYKDKLSKLGQVIGELGTDLNPDGFALMGCAEVENRHVLKDLCKQSSLSGRNLQVIHLEGPDERSVDPGLIYNPKYFKPASAKGLFVNLKDGDDLTDTSKWYTRDILWVSGELNGERTHVFVMHWPSRRGGEEASAPKRAIAAATARRVIDSLLIAEPNAHIIAMGDLNDDPVNASVSQYLKAKGLKENLSAGDLFNPFTEFYKKGIGTLAWGDAWNLFDQIVISQNLYLKSDSKYRFHHAEVFNKNYLMQKTGNFKGYPNRCYVGTEYQGGYSDHFPVIIYLTK